MKFRGLIVAVIVLAALAGVLYWSQHRKTPIETATVPAATPAILKIDPSSVTELVIKQKGLDPVTLKKTDGKWQITEPKTYRADQEAGPHHRGTASACRRPVRCRSRGRTRGSGGRPPAP